MGIVQDDLNNMQPEQVKCLKYQGHDFNSDYKKFLPVVEEVIHLALQGQLKIVDSSHQKTATGLYYIDQLCFKRHGF